MHYTLSSLRYKKRAVPDWSSSLFLRTSRTNNMGNRDKHRFNRYAQIYFIRANPFYLRNLRSKSRN